MGCYYGKTIAKLTDAERGSFEASLRGGLDFYKSLIEDPWTSGPLMRLGSLYNKTKPEDTPVFPVALQQDSLLYLEGKDNKETPFEGLGFYLTGYGLVTAWHVICDAVSHDMKSKEIKVSNSDKTPLARFRFGIDVLQENKRDAAVLQEVPSAVIKNIPQLPANIDLPTKGEKIFAFQPHFSDYKFSFELHRGDLLRVGDLCEEGTLCYTNCSFRHGMSGGPVFNGLGQVIGIVHSATEQEKLGSFLPLKDCIRSTDVYGKWILSKKGTDHLYELSSNYKAQRRLTGRPRSFSDGAFETYMPTISTTQV